MSKAVDLCFWEVKNIEKLKGVIFAIYMDTVPVIKISVELALLSS